MFKLFLLIFNLLKFINKFICVLGGIVQKSKGIFYLSPSDEKDYYLATSDFDSSLFSKIDLTSISLRKNDAFITAFPRKINFIGCFNNQNISLGTGLIPYLEHDDANRALMGSNMQRQALPLKNKELSFVDMGVERQVYKASEINVMARSSGIVNFSSNKNLVISSNFSPLSSNLFNKKLISDFGNNNLEIKKNEYSLVDFRKSNQSSLLSQSPILKVGDWVKKGDILVEGNCSLKGKVCLQFKFLGS